MYRRHPNHVPNGHEREAFEAGQAGLFATYEAFEHWYYVCRDCGRNTKGMVIHHCPARADKEAS